MPKEKDSIMKCNPILTIGAVAAGIAAAGLIGAAGCCVVNECGKGHHRHSVCNCGFTPIRDMKRMARNIKEMMSDVL